MIRQNRKYLKILDSASNFDITKSMCVITGVLKEQAQALSAARIGPMGMLVVVVVVVVVVVAVGAVVVVVVVAES